MAEDGGCANRGETVLAVLISVRPGDVFGLLLFVFLRLGPFGRRSESRFARLADTRSRLAIA